MISAFSLRAALPRQATKISWQHILYNFRAIKVVFRNPRPMVLKQMRECQEAPSNTESNVNCSGVSLVLPVLNESDTLPAFFSVLQDGILNQKSNPINEVVIVDDGSIDGSRDMLMDFKESHPDLRVNVILRDRAFGSANAEIVGCAASSNPWAIKMDVDGQHPMNLVRDFCRFTKSSFDAIVASRYVPEAGNDWAPLRGVISRSARILSKVMIPGARQVADPVSGCFMIRSELALGLQPSLAHYKMLLYLLAKYPRLKVLEIPFTMKDRIGGVSKIATNPVTYVPRYLTELMNYQRVSLCSGSVNVARRQRQAGPTKDPSAPSRAVQTESD